jgi:hypothetical protein
MLLKKWLAAFLLMSVSVAHADDTLGLLSPNHIQSVLFMHQPDGQLKYALTYKTKMVVQPSLLAIKFSTPDVTLNKFDLVKFSHRSVDDSWKPVWGEVSTIENSFNELTLQLKDRSGSNILVNIVFRAFDDGIGFRYEFPAQEGLNHFIVADEMTQFRVGMDLNTFWIPGDYDSNEFGYHHTRLSEVDASKGGQSAEIFAKTFFDKNAVQTPLMMKSDQGIYINIHEAALVDYPAMDLIIDKSTFTLQSHLVPDAVGNMAYLQTPSHTPWRTIIVSDKATEILASKMILNLNEPTKLTDVSWIKPQKFVGVWWEMHIGKSSWDYSGLQVGSQQVTKVPHGANTANVKKYIDFAARYGFDGVLVEGWNTGWEDWFGQWKENVFDFVTPYPDYDIDDITAYAKARGVKIICHHETSASATNYERWMDTAYRFMLNHNMNSVKTGYVGHIIPRGEHHDGQWMVNHYVRVAAKTASYHIMVDMHEPVRPTGLQRTYPNWLACEAARGNEFNAWSVGNPPDHETILPFTRLMGGPMDYTPGLFRIKLNQYDTKKTEQIHTTLTKQLALYVTMYSPLQMAADLPENYEAHLDALQFIRDVAVDWDDTKILQAEPGDYIIEARKAKGKDSWFLGAITDENARSFSQPLSFLDAGKKYLATIYRDADDADWKNNPEAYVIEHRMVDSKATINLKLAPGGGTAISFTMLDKATADKMEKEMKKESKNKKKSK